VPHQRGREIGENVWTSVNSSDIIMFDENGAAL
jgi:hypothetical protein